MVYQRYIPQQELFSAQLELLMRNGQLATVASNLIGVCAAIAIFWPFMDITSVLLWGAAFLILLLLRSLQMTNALATRSYQEFPRRVYRRLVAGAAMTGAAWAGLYIVAAHYVPIVMQYTFLLLILMITAISLGFSVIIREYFIAYLFASVLPIAWWSLAHYWDQPYNTVIGLALLAFCGVLVVLCDRLHQAFRNMISINWEREAMARDLGELTHSLRDRNKQLQVARRKLTDLANIDELTGLGNRRLVNSALQQAIRHASDSRSNLSLILLDVDFFKKYNDAYGHPAGDSVLQRLAQVMLGIASREGEVVARYGGEEFILILPGASSDAALRTAERLRLLVELEGIPHTSSEASSVVTVSQGVVTVLPDDTLQPSAIITRADKALYEAKRQGRNRVVAEESPAREAANGLP